MPNPAHFFAHLENPRIKYPKSFRLILSNQKIECALRTLRKQSRHRVRVSTRCILNRRISIINADVFQCDSFVFILFKLKISRPVENCHDADYHSCDWFVGNHSYGITSGIVVDLLYQAQVWKSEFDVWTCQDTEPVRRWLTFILLFVDLGGCSLCSWKPRTTYEYSRIFNWFISGWCLVCMFALPPRT